jgi:DNA replicative helicase MCM subunit Mcm2 (Cdc46/Mcm family)
MNEYHGQDFQFLSPFYEQLIFIFWYCLDSQARLDHTMPVLSQVQRDDAERLWKSQLREVVEIRTSKEQPLHQQIKSVILGHDLEYIDKLHDFFLAHLCLILSSGQQDASVATGNDHHHHPSSQFLKYYENPLQSCLSQFVRLALVSSATVAAQSFDFVKDDPQQHTSHNNNNNNGSAKKVVWLWEGRRVIALHYSEFIQELNHYLQQGKTDTVPDHRSTFECFLYHYPQRALSCIGTAMSLAMLTLWRKHNNCHESVVNAARVHNNNNHNQSHKALLLEKLDRFLDASKIQVRLINVEPKMNMMDIKTSIVGKFISIKGHVVKARPKRLRVAVMDFQCKKCKATIIHAFDSGKYSVPTRCTTLNCKSKAFLMTKKMAHYTDVQELKLQEAQDESIMHSGRTPRQMAVELTHDLVDTCRPGDIVLLGCVVDTVNAAVAAGKKGKRAKEACTYTLVLLGHSITTLSETTNQNKANNNSNNKNNNKTSSTQFSQQQLQAITQLCHADHKFFSMTERMAFPFDLLVRSLCPAIFGHHEVKAGILLCLLGGTPPSNPYTKKAASEEIRSNSHILIVGDPGMGKSQMLLAATQLAARSVFVGGTSTSTTGLTVTLTKEENGESGIEAGALVLADNGICCIDGQ